MSSNATGWDVGVADVAGPESAAVLRDYYVDIVSRYHGRPATPDEVDAALRDEPSGDLAPPTGVFLLGRVGGRVGGCVGLRWAGGGVAELTRLFVRAEARGSGGGGALLAAAERAARDAGMAQIRLDTRHDLVEARRLYARSGYAEVPAFSSGPYSEHWFAKRLAPAGPGAPPGPLSDSGPRPADTEEAL
ncbi:GNAT family N-acetyltransferase [Streptomonospora nanhaiensis]|uniref:GNAT superfamily N-acetyltransferase n=1 Tax=Streptomonospora nanhaiensis TaxID=1323731 RepID=A0A853BTM8_9ACTN|nr:GNAT family N-acetyltransferase [Streptomonospora nanhaiensis]MBX9386837.1 GNAT family N-acetyltransferase [Streptomonospora nanhaiensis]NYI98096.1 GNAT superfamily N-acetyltransferase [Streptomonospora nanhaiensis]